MTANACFSARETTVFEAESGSGAGLIIQASLNFSCVESGGGAGKVPGDVSLTSAGVGGWVEDG